MDVGFSGHEVDLINRNIYFFGRGVMHKPAFELFLAESTALALRGEQDASLGFASALQKRHKIRKTDLEKLLDAAASTKPDTAARARTVIALIIYAGAAYEDIGELIKAGNLRKQLVRPHWSDTGKTYALEKVVLWEPMNLFAGWAIVNTSNNAQTFDAHWVVKLKDEDDLSSYMEVDLEADTDMMAVAKAMGGQNPTMVIDNDSRPTLKRELTPHSAFQNSHYKKMQYYMNDRVGGQRLTSSKNVRVTRAKQTPDKKDDRLEKLKKMAVESTKAGTAHYAQLISSLENKFTFDLDELDILRAAGVLWKQHRRSLTQEASTWCLQLSHAKWR